MNRLPRSRPRRPIARVRKTELRLPGVTANRYIRKVEWAVHCPEHGEVDRRETHNGAHHQKALHNRARHAAVAA